MRIVEETLARVINPDLVQRINAMGGKAIGQAGTTVFLGRRKNEELGYVGEVVECDTSVIDLAVAGEVVPVVSPVAREVSTGHTLNVNADIAACALAKKLKAPKLIFLSDVLGVMRDPKDDSTLIPTLNSDSPDRPTEGRGHHFRAGMIPKVDSAPGLACAAASARCISLMAAFPTRWFWSVLPTEASAPRSRSEESKCEFLVSGQISGLFQGQNRFTTDAPFFPPPFFSTSNPFHTYTPTHSNPPCPKTSSHAT